ncbi:methylated-DNA--[protein]-cysteine S-methyltransferase [Alphaproteobacteria bacterium LSUCC0719]
MIPHDTTLTGRFHITFHNRFGHMRAVSDGHHLIRLDWDQNPFATPDNPDDVSRETCRQITAYLAGSRQHFTLPLMAEGTSQTGRAWLTAMALIPYGTTISYAEYAALAGKPQAPRAAGTACSTNPIPIIYPCHRVVRKDGALGHYGGGSTLSPRHPDNLDRKQALIDLERAFA